MMLVLANLLLLFTGGPAVLLVSSNPRTGPEGPVGVHMVTAPLAIGQAVAVGLGLAAGALAWPGWAGAVLGILLPGYVVAMTVLPILALDRRWRPLAVAAVHAAVAGCALVVNGAALPVAFGLAGAGLVAAVAVGGYAMLAMLWLQSMRNHAAVAAADQESRERFRTEQSAWQLGEWNKLPADAELWQLIQFAHALHPEVEAACRARIAAFPDLDARMDALLRTGWAEHALRYVAEHYPHSRAALAPALRPFLLAEGDKWEAQLRHAELPHTWQGNLAKYVDCMVAVRRDGGDLAEPIARWRTMLAGLRGLAHLASRLDVA